jgi:GAF domain-containing protein/anti-sigma regulatory factor (Ser/Thr protein kinase)
VTIEELPPDDASFARLRHLQSISEAALAHLRFDDLVRELLARLVEILEADTAAVLLTDAETNELVARAAHGLEEEVEARVRVPLGRGFAGRIAAERRTVAIDDVDRADIFNPILREKGLRSLLGAPLVVQGELIGVLHVGTLTPRMFTSSDAELLQAAGDRIALAIDHSRLYDLEIDARAAAEEAAEQLRRLEAVTEAALAHLALDDLLEVLLIRVRELIGTDTAVVMTIDEERGELVGRATVGVEGRIETVTLGEGFSGRIAAEGRPLAVDDIQSSEFATDSIRGAGLASMLGVPLVVGGRVTGVLGMGTLVRRVFTAGDTDLLQRAGDRIALAMENARLYEAERTARAAAEQAAERIRRIESISEVALHHIALEDEVLERLLSRVRDALGTDTAALLVIDDERQTLVARAAKGLEEEVERGIEVPVGRGFAGRVAEQRAPLVVEDASEIEVVSPLLRQRMRSLAGVPLAIDDRLLGVLHVGTRERRSFSAEDMTLLALAGERLAVALDHSRLFAREHFVAETLQRSLLPESLPELPGATVASRYLPGEGEAVGGDWYDVVPLRDGRFALAMGDVVSRGVRAASVMGQLRNALRAYAIEGHDPPQLLERLDAMARAIDGQELATVVYAVVAPETGTMEYATAGHPPPMVLEGGGEVVLLEEGRGPPLGALPDAIYSCARAELGPGATLLLYTDGLVERRDMWIDEGLERLSAVAAAADEMAPDELVEHLVTTLIEGAAADDVAVLALRMDPAPAGPLTLRLDADPTVLAPMRQSLRGWLAAVGAGEDECYDVLVAATEAAANAVEHAYGPGDARFDVEARAVRGHEVSVVVRDTGSWRPPRGQNRGRGTLLMQELMDEFEVTTGESGTEVRMSKRLAGALAA